MSSRTSPPSRSGRAGVAGRRHRRRHRLIAGQAAGDHARAQVAVGEDPERAVAEVDDHRGLLRRGHHLGRLADRGVRRADDRLAADQRRRRAGATGRRRSSAASAPAAFGRMLEQRARHEAQPGRARKRLLRDVGGDPVAERVLAGARLEAGGQAGQHRGVAEQLALAEQVEHAAVEHDLDRARCAPPAGARPARRPGRRSSCRRRWNSTSAAAATRSTSPSSSASNGGCCAQEAG